MCRAGEEQCCGEEQLCEHWGGTELLWSAQASLPAQPLLVPLWGHRCILPPLPEAKFPSGHFSSALQGLWPYNVHLELPWRKRVIPNPPAAGVGTHPAVPRPHGNSFPRGESVLSQAPCHQGGDVSLSRPPAHKGTPCPGGSAWLPAPWLGISCIYEATPLHKDMEFIRRHWSLGAVRSGSQFCF